MVVGGLNGQRFGKMVVDVFVLGDYKGRIDVSEDSLVGLLAQRRYDKLPEKIKEIEVTYSLLVLPIDSEKKDDSK